MLDPADLLRTISPKITGQSFLIPNPTQPAFESMIHRLAFVNRFNLYRRQCDGTQKPIVSVYSPDKPVTVYSRSHWESDNWDAASYGQPYDFNKTFAEQWDALNLAVPHIALWSTQTDNADYTHDVANVKDSYLIFDASEIEDSLYLYAMNQMTSCVDCAYGVQSELLYHCTYVENSYQSMVCAYSDHLSDCAFCYDCSNCKNCFGCVNLHSAQYCWFNEQLTQEEYEKRRAAFWQQPDFMEQAAQQLETLKRSLPHRADQIKQSENCTGDDLAYCQNCLDSFDCVSSQDLIGCHDIVASSQALNSGNLIAGISGAYECQNVTAGAQNIAFCFLCADGISNAYYSTECYSSDHIFGCVGLKHKKLSILNTSYTQHEYDALLPRIIGHMQETGEWGKFLPAWTSVFGYNESAAATFLPLTEKQAQNQGYNWSDYDPPLPDFPKKLSAAQVAKIPRAHKVKDDLTTWALTCTETGKLYQIQAMELLFYRKFNLPLPTQHPKQRLLNLFEQKNPRKLREHACVKCHTTVTTTYSEDAPYQLYCTTCYAQAVLS